MAELLRAINEAVAGRADEVVEVPVDDDDHAVLLQAGQWTAVNTYQADGTSLMQMAYDPAIPFGAKLSMLQAHLNGMDEGKSSQAAAHLKIMAERLRRLAGDLTRQRQDRFERLEALIAGYYTEPQDTPLELQIWCEKQLQVLVPYLGGGTGRTPTAAPAGPSGCSTAGSSTDVFIVNDSFKDTEELPEYRVRRTENGEWEPATDQEAAEFSAHDRAVAEEQALQEARDAENFQAVEAAMQQRWDDWAMRSELDRGQPLPSRKRIRVVMTVGGPEGREVGEAEVVGVVEASQVPIVSFKVEETLLGGVEGGAGTDHGPAATAAHAAPQLAVLDPECLPGLGQEILDIMSTREARHWLKLFAEGLTTTEVIATRFGARISEVFEMWVAVQNDAGEAALNCGDKVVSRTADGEEDGNDATSSEASTIAVEGPAVTSPLGRPMPVSYVTPTGEAAAGSDSGECPRGGADLRGMDCGGVSENVDADSAQRSEMDVDGNLEGEELLAREGARESERRGDGARMNDSTKGVLEVAEGNTESLPTAGPASRPGGGAGEEGDGVLRAEEDELDPFTGIPRRWAEFWRQTNADLSLGVGFPGPDDSVGTSISDGLHTMPGNVVGPTQADDVEEVAGGSVAAVASGTETRTTSSTEVSEESGVRQTDLRSWLK